MKYVATGEQDAVLAENDLRSRSDGADRRARVASRAMGLLVAVLSLAVAALGAVHYFNPRRDATLESSGLPIGVLLVITLTLGSMLLGPSNRWKRPASNLLRTREGAVTQVDGRA